jgi:phospholipid/cholesterol/gamma-HCH transport system permease protein
MLKQVAEFFDNIGSGFLYFLEYIGRAINILGATLYYIGRLAIEWPLTVVQMSTMGVNSMPIVFLVVSFTGMFLSLMLTQQAVRFGTVEYVGAAIVYVMIRELVPVLSAVVIAGRVGSSIASEIGSMKVSEQIDALRSLATNPVQYLVVPRMVALVIMLPVVSVFAGLVSIMMSYLVAYQAGGLEWIVFMKNVPNVVDVKVVMGALIKSVSFAVTIAIIGCVEGMYTEGGAVGVGRATTNAVVVSMVLIFALNFLLSMLLFPIKF